jgi:plasmid maintenance system antidote protein VapI
MKKTEMIIIPEKKSTIKKTFCDICGKSISIFRKCEKCHADLCTKCSIVNRYEYTGDYEEYICPNCELIRQKYQAKIDELEHEIDKIEEEIDKECLNKKQLFSNIVISPGETFEEYLKNNNFSNKHACKKLNFNNKELELFISGKIILTNELAKKLKSFTGLPVSFWKGLENKYRNAILTNKQPWKTFWFDGNLAWGNIDTKFVWERIKRDYELFNEDPFQAQQKNDGSNIFGFKTYHNGITLKEFFKQNGMKE